MMPRGRINSGITLVQDSAPIEINTVGGSDPDERWDYTDEAGHYHFWMDRKTPTLVSVDEEPYWCFDCNDEHTPSHLECRICGEEINPGMKSSSGRVFIPGPVSMRIEFDDGRQLPITPEEFAALDAFRIGTGDRGLSEYAEKLWHDSPLATSFINSGRFGR